MEIKWIKNKNEITEDKIEAATNGRNVKVKIRKGKSNHERNKKLADIRAKEDKEI